MSNRLNEVLTFKYNNVVTFSVKISSKLTLLQGPAARGKTVFISSAGSARFADQLDSVVTYEPTTDVTVDEFIERRKQDDIVFIDEDNVSEFKKHGRMRRLFKKPIYLVIAHRGNFPELTYSYRDVYTLETIDGLTRLVREYPDYSKFPIRNESFVCEDEKAGYQYFNDRLPNAKSMKGRKNCLKYNNRETLILDGAAIGSYINQLELKNVQLFLPVSFEYLLIKHFTKLSFDELMQWYSPSFLSFERYFTALCERRRILGFTYLKRTLPNVVYGEVLFPELCGTVSKHVIDAHATLCIQDISSKDNCRDEIAKYLAEIGRSDSFERVFDTLPTVLEPDTFVATIDACLRTIE